MLDLIVYTAITGNKDELQPMKPTPGVQYVCFSDKKFTHNVWQFRPIEPNGICDMRRICRKHKVLSHIYFPGKTTVWIDGRVEFKIPVQTLINRYKKTICCRQHPARKCIYDEAAIILKQDYDDPATVTKQMARYKDEGYPAMNGLAETGFLIRRPCKETEEFNRRWWAEISSGSKRDQLSFNYVLWKMKLQYQSVRRDSIVVHKHKIKTSNNT